MYLDFRDDKVKPDHVRLFNLLISNIGTEYLWQQFTKHLAIACKNALLPADSNCNWKEPVQPVGAKEILFGEVLHIMDFMLDMTSIDNFPESTLQYLPNILLQIVSCLQENCHLISTTELDDAIHLLCRMVSKIQPCNSFQKSKEIGKAFDCLSDIKEECESLTSEIIKATENALNSSQEKLEPKLGSCVTLQQVCSGIETFFATIFNKRIVSNPEQISLCFEFITCREESGHSQRVDMNIEEKCTQLYGSLCDLLVQTALITLSSAELNNNNAGINSYRDQNLPFWIKQLLVLSYNTEEKWLKINYISIACILNLMSILKSQLLEQPLQTALLNVIATGSPVLDFSKSKPETLPTTCVDYLFRQQDVQHIYTQTAYFLRITERLWDNLTEDLNAHHLETATLLQQLHNLLEDSPICEAVICAAMACNDEAQAYQARSKFCMLFSITRDIKQKNPVFNSMREFDRPLFFMLDALTHKLDVHNTLSLDWLHQSIANNDIARILEPILFILLHPDTNRVSIQHVNIQPSDTTSESYSKSADAVESRSRIQKANDEQNDISVSESKIFAISSTEGNVIYYINPEGKKRFTESRSKRWANFKPGTPECDRNSAGEHSNSSTKQLSVNINMFFNPFGSLSSLESEAMEVLEASGSLGANELANARRIPGRRLICSNDVHKTSSATPVHTPSICSNREFFENACSDSDIIGKLVEELVDQVAERLERGDEEDDEDGYESSSESESFLSENTRHTFSESFNTSGWLRPISVNQLHCHLLLYYRVYDHKRSLYALTTLWNLILAEPQKILFDMATTSISNRLGVRAQELQQICARHKKSLFGKGFYGELDGEFLNPFRNSSFLELIVTTCLYYIRSYYPNQNRLSEEEIHGNQKVRILSCEILRLIFRELIGNLKANSTFSTYIYDMLGRCSVQKHILHTVVSSVYNFQQKDHQQMSRLNKVPLTKSSKPLDNEEFSDALIDFNERLGSPGFQEDMQKCLLKLLEQLMFLEYRTSPVNTCGEKETSHSKKDSDSRASRIRFQPQMSSLKYCPNVMISSQSMFFSAVQTSLQQLHKANLHSNWLALVESSLPIANRSLTRIVVCVITQLCHNLEHLAEQISSYNSNTCCELQMPSNYLITLLKSFSNLCHFCLIDISGSSTQTIAGHQSLASPLSTSTSSLGPLQVLSNLFHTLTPGDNTSDASAVTREAGASGVASVGSTLSMSATAGSESLLSTRRTVLSHLPRVLASLLSVWKVVDKVEAKQEAATSAFNAMNGSLVNVDLNSCSTGGQTEGWQVMGSARDIKNSILSLLNPISLIHGQSFMAAVAILWFDLKHSTPEVKIEERRKPVIPPFSQQQLSLVKLIAAIRVLPMESVFQIVKQVMKQPPLNMLSRKKRVPLEVCMLQFLLAYIREFSGSQLLECWRSLLHLLKEGSQLATNQPPMQFHLLAILHEFVQIAPLIEARKDQKDLQDVAQKLIDACTTVAGGRLGQSRWLRRNLEVKPGPQQLMEADDESEKEMDELSNKFDSNSYDINNELIVAKYSVHALNALAEV